MATPDAKTVSNSIKEELTTLFTNIADAIRIKEKSLDNISPEDFPRRISAIETEETGEETTYKPQNVVETAFQVTLPVFSPNANTWYFYDGTSFQVYSGALPTDITLIPSDSFFIRFANLATAGSYQVYLISSDDTIIEDIKINDVFLIVLSTTHIQLKYEIYDLSLTDIEIKLSGKLVSYSLGEELTIPNSDPLNTSIGNILNEVEVTDNQNLNTIMDSILV